VRYIACVLQGAEHCAYVCVALLRVCVPCIAFCGAVLSYKLYLLFEASTHCLLTNVIGTSMSKV
jgi:hypothetical protein